jgi:elongation factor P
MQVSATDIRVNHKIKFDNDIWVVTESMHRTQSRQSGFMQISMKSLTSGRTNSVKLRSNDSVEKITLEQKMMNYMYHDGIGGVFMDNESFDQITVPDDILGDALMYIKENTEIKVEFYDDKPIGVEPPNNVELEVTETDPGLKGDTVSGSTKPATVETGAVIQVPLFIEIGNVLKIDTRTNEYLGRATKAK